MADDNTLVEMRSVSRHFRSPAELVHAVDDIDLKMSAGDVTVVSGPSGSGKTTLLLMAAAMLRPTTGKVDILGDSAYDKSLAARTRMRRERITTILPLFHLLPYLSALGNVRLGGKRGSRAKAEELLEQLGLTDRAHHRPHQLSSGERRRVMVARALMSGAPILLADEPTANLDEENAEIVRRTIKQHADNGGTSFVVTHEPAARFGANHSFRMESGKLSRSGRASGWVVAAICSIAVIGLLIGILANNQSARTNSSSKPIRLICAAGIKPPVDAVIEKYQDETSRRVTVRYGGSGTLLGGLKVDPDSAELYLAADDSYVQLAREAGLAAESIPLATMKPVIAVAAGNPKEIRTAEDLLRADIKVGLAKPEAAAVGKISKQAFTESGIWDELSTKVKVFKTTVNDIANDLHLGTIDAAIIWDSTVLQYDNLEAIPIPELDQHVRTVAVTVVSTTDRASEALHFARYLAARDRGCEIFEEFGYGQVEADVWESRPQLLLYAGSMFNKPIEETIRSFAKREGVEVDRVYNGCGILLSQMAAGGEPDAFLSCDDVFLERVDDQFRESIELSANPMVIIAQKGNPHSLSTLSDLAKEDLKIGLAHPEKSALGHLTQQLLREQNLLQSIEASGNWVQDAPQGDFLANALRTGALDAAIVYRSNAQPWSDELELIPIDLPSATSHQPAAIANNSKYPRLAGRLLDAIRSAQSAERFEELGFTWLDDGSEPAASGPGR